MMGTVCVGGEGVSMAPLRDCGHLPSPLCFSQNESVLGWIVCALCPGLTVVPLILSVFYLSPLLPVYIYHFICTC